MEGPKKPHTGYPHINRGHTRLRTIAQSPQRLPLRLLRLTPDRHPHPHDPNYCTWRHTCLFNTASTTTVEYSCNTTFESNVLTTSGTLVYTHKIHPQLLLARLLVRANLTHNCCRLTQLCPQTPPSTACGTLAVSRKLHRIVHSQRTLPLPLLRLSRGPPSVGVRVRAVRSISVHNKSHP